MKNSFFKLPLLLVLLSVISFSCFEIKPVEVGDIQGIRIKKLSGKSVSLDVLLPINNPNTFKFKITGVNLDIVINNVNLGKVKNIDKVTVPARSNQTYSFLVEVEFPKILTGAISLFKSLMESRVKVKLTGHIKVRAFFISKTIKVNEEKTVKLFK